MKHPNARPDKVVEELKATRQQLSDKCCSMVDSELKYCSKAHIEPGIVNYCTAYAFPSKMWRLGDCILADSFLRSDLLERTKKGKIRVGQQKSKKKKNRR